MSEAEVKPNPGSKSINNFLAKAKYEKTKNKIPAKKGGRIAKNARLELEQKTGKKIISGSNYLPQGQKRLK